MKLRANDAMSACARKSAGTPERPRLNVYRSLDNIYAQVIDDTTGNTLVSASTVDKALRGDVAQLNKTEQAKAVGKVVAERAHWQQGHQGGGFRPRRLSLSWPGEGTGRRQP